MTVSYHVAVRTMKAGSTWTAPPTKQGTFMLRKVTY